MERDGKNAKVRAWLLRTHPEERSLMGGFSRDVTFDEIYRRMHGGEEFYEIAGCTESVQREYIFARLAELYGRDYDYFYRLWLEAGAKHLPERAEALARTKGITLGSRSTMPEGKTEGKEEGQTR